MATMVHLGWFDDPVEAARVRDRKAADLYGPYAFLNLPGDLEPRPVPPDPSHPERPLRYTGPFGYLRCPAYWPLSPDDKVIIRRVGGMPRFLHRTLGP